MARERIVVGIDVGTTKVTALIAEVGRNRHAHVVGSAVVPSRGMKKGIVVDIDDAAKAILSAIEKAERVSGHKVHRASVSISGNHLTSLNNRAYIAVARSPQGITDDDVARVLDAAQVVNVPSNRGILHVIPRQFILDGQEGIRNPVGMRGYRLDAEVHLVIGAATAIQNLVGCLETLGIEVGSVVVTSLAASEAVLTEEEKTMGVALVDVGGGTTSVAIFVDGSVCHTGIIPVGGSHVTNDIAVHLRTPFAEAEDLKLRHVHAYSSEVDPDEQIEVPSFHRSELASVRRRDVCLVAEARLQETFQLVGEEIQRAAPAELLSAGVVLVGGTAHLSGVADLASEVLKLPVRVGRLTGVYGLIDTIDSPAYAASAGVLLWAVRYPEHQHVTARDPARHSIPLDEPGHPDVPRGAGRLKGWLRAILP